MKRIFFIALLAAISMMIQAQTGQTGETTTKKKGIFPPEKILDKLANEKKLTIDYQQIEDFVKQHPEEYKELMRNFQSSFTSLYTGDVARLYYGYAFTKDFVPLNIPQTVKIQNLINVGKLEKAYNLCKKELKKAPVSLALLSKMTNIIGKFNKSGNTEKKAEGISHLARLTILFQTILESGTGFDKDHAMKVVYVPDEFVVFDKMMGLELLEQEIVDDRYHCMTLDNNGKHLTLWFDTYLSKKR